MDSKRVGYGTSSRTGTTPYFHITGSTLPQRGSLFPSRFPKESRLCRNKGRAIRVDDEYLTYARSASAASPPSRTGTAKVFEPIGVTT